MGHVNLEIKSPGLKIPEIEIPDTYTGIKLTAHQAKIAHNQLIEIIDHPKELHAFLKHGENYFHTFGELPLTNKWIYLENISHKHPHRFFHYHPEFKEILSHPKPPPVNSIPEPSGYILITIGVIFVLFGLFLKKKWQI